MINNSINIFSKTEKKDNRSRISKSVELKNEFENDKIDNYISKSDFETLKVNISN